MPPYLLIYSIEQISGFTALGGIKYFGEATIAQTSSVSAIGSLKWEDDTVTTTNYTDQTVTTTTWTDQSDPSTSWSEAA